MGSSATMKPPKRKVVSNRMIGGYRGHPTRMVLLECGHYISNRWNAQFCRESKLIPGKSKCACWECIKPVNP